MNVRMLGIVGASATLAFVSAAYAHAPIFACTQKGQTVRCEAGFSDGASAAGKKVAVLDSNHRVLVEGTVAANGTYEFSPPAGVFHVAFDGGQYHQVTIYSTDIEKE